MDLRPFRKLLSVLGMLRCAPDELPALLRRMPRRLESLCLTAENLPEPRDFDVGESASAAGVGGAGRLESSSPVACLLAESLPEPPLAGKLDTWMGVVARAGVLVGCAVLLHACSTAFLYDDTCALRTCPCMLCTCCSARGTLVI